MLRVLLILVSILMALPLRPSAQEAAPETDPEDNGFVINLIQEALSSETRQIRFSGVTGALSSNARIERITVADGDGVWLTVENASIIWTRTALLRGRLSVSALTAERIEVLRKPAAPDPEAAQTGLPDAAESRFTLPELPVSVRIDRLEVARIEIGAAVFGQQAAMDLNASLVLEDGRLDASLAVNRLDGPAGRLRLQAGFDNATEQLEIDLDLNAPPDGLLTGLLNIEGRPAIDLRLSGAGPLSDFAAELGLDADARRLVSGKMRLRDTAAGRGFDLTVSGDIRPLVPAPYRGFFAGDGLVSARGAVPRTGGLRLDALLVTSAALQLAGKGEFDASGFPVQLELTGHVAGPDAEPVLLPVPGGDVTLRTAILDVNLSRDGAWRTAIAFDDLRTGDIAIGTGRLAFDGTAGGFRNGGVRRIAGRISGLLDGLDFPDPATGEALGSRIELAAGIDWAETRPLVIDAARISGNGLALGLDGTVSAGAFDGTLTARVADLTPFSRLSGYDLSGLIDIRATGQVRPLTGGFDLTLEGRAFGLGLGDPRIDPLLAGEAALAGGLFRDPSGIGARKFRLENDQLSLRADGRYALSGTDFALEARLSDVGLVTGEAGGPLSVSARALGNGTSGLDLDAEVLSPDMRLDRRRLQDARLAFDGHLAPNRDLEGRIEGTGTLDGLLGALTGDLAVTRAVAALHDFSFVTDGLALAGDIERSAAGLLSGDLDLEAPDIAPAAGLALLDAAGSVYATLDLQPVSDRQNLRIDAEIDGFSLGTTTLGSGRIDATIVDLFGQPLADGDLRLRDARLGGYAVRTLTATAARSGEEMELTAEADLENGTHAELGGALTRLDRGLRVALSRLLVEQGDLRAVLNSRPVLELIGENLSLTPLDLAIGDGALRLSGRIADTLALDFTAEALPVSIVNAINAGFAAGGRIDGTARLTGSRTAPDATFRLRIADFTAAPLAASGLPPVSLSAVGNTDTARGLLDLDAALTSESGIDARLGGTVPLAAEAGEADLDVSLVRFPLQIMRRLSGDAGLAGSLSGTARVTGPLDGLDATYRLTGEGLTASVLQRNGVPALHADLAGSYAGEALRIETARIGGPGGLSLEASGSVPLRGPGLDVTADGTVPLSLANTLLARQAMQVSGNLQVSARASGRLAAPDLSGIVRLADGAFVMPLYNLRIEQIALTASLRGDEMILDEARGRFATGGKLIASGAVGLDPSAGFPADLNVRLDSAKIVDGTYLATELEGGITITGPLTRGPLIAGKINLDGTEIVLPEQFSVSAGTLLDVAHRNPPEKVRMTLVRAEATGSGRAENGRSGPPVLLDLEITSANRIFIRGWGLDTELGGRLRIRGTLDDIRPVGSFDMLRGRIQILGRRLDFVEGRASFTGNLRPTVFFRTESAVNEYLVSLIVDGTLPEPDIRFESTPELPEDEVLALLLFNRSLSELSPLQAARLAGAVASLRRGARPGVTDTLRGALGFDDLDFTTGDEGQAGISAGKYIDDETYVELETRTDGLSQATITYDISRNVRARGAVTSEGEASIGIFFERDY